MISIFGQGGFLELELNVLLFDSVPFRVCAPYSETSSVVNPDPNYARIQQLCGSGSPQVNKAKLEAKGVGLKKKIHRA